MSLQYICSDKNREYEIGRQATHVPGVHFYHGADLDGSREADFAGIQMSRRVRGVAAACLPILGKRPVQQYHCGPHELFHVSARV